MGDFTSDPIEDQQQEIDRLRATVAEKEQALAESRQQLADRERTIATLETSNAALLLSLQERERELAEVTRLVEPIAAYVKAVGVRGPGILLTDYAHSQRNAIRADHLRTISEWHARHKERFRA